METEQFDTPQKSKSSTTLSNLWTQNGLKTSGGGCGSPNAASKHHRKPLHPRTPNGNSSSQTSANSTSCSSFHIFPNPVVNTPPAKRFHRVRNPFEAALAERLHLPLIASPSLFQRPATPQLSSTQFEWTIDDVSSLKPAHLEPHETQFHDSPDPDYEAKAQSAISSYFKEQQIVPSPVDCPLRNHRIILSEMNGNTPISKPGRRIRDCGTQTELSFPVVLPKALEEALKPYFQPHLSENDDNESTPCDRGQRSHSYMSNNSTSVGDFKDTSLRRKLFDMHNIIVLDGENKFSSANNSLVPNSNSSPVASLRTVQRTAIVGKLSDSMDKSSFGSLSPISATDGLSISPHSPSSARRKSRLQNFLDLSESEALSPIHPPVRAACSRRKSLKNSINAVISNDNYRSPANMSEQTFGELSTIDNEGKFTPDRSSSPLNSLENAEQSVDSSFNIKVSRLLVNSSKMSQANSSGRSKITTKKTNVELELFLHDDTDDMLDIDDEDMQVSQLSAHGSTCSSTSSDTPRGKRRSASRKNLSQSFSINWLEDEDEAAAAVASRNAEAELQPQLGVCSKQKDANRMESITNTTGPGGVSKQISQEQRLLFYRTDSGFNEMTSSQTTTASNDEHSGGEVPTQEQDVSMVCCSTPSKQTAGVAF